MSEKHATESHEPLKTGVEQRVMPVGKRFAPGVSGNPGGRPKIIAHVQELARAETEADIAALVEIRDDIKSPAAARVLAANSLLDRAWGKPPAKFEADVSLFETLPPAARENLDAVCELLLQRYTEGISEQD